MNTRQDYREVEVIRDPDGVVAIITERITTGKFSFRIIKEYVLNGVVKQTAFFGRRHLPAVARITTRVADRLDILEDVHKVERAVTR